MALNFTIGTFDDDNNITLSSGTGDQDDMVMAVAETASSASGWDVAYVTHNSNSYICLQSHTSNLSNDEPGVGTNWTTYWWQTPDNEATTSWADSTSYDRAPITTSDGTTYTINNNARNAGGNAPAIYVNTTLNIESGKTLQWDCNANRTPAMQVGGTLNIAAGVTITADLNDTYQARHYFYGVVNCSGTSGNEIIFQQHRSINFYMNYWTGTTAYDWDYVIIRNPTGITYESIIFDPTDFRIGNLNHSFKNITLTDTGISRSGRPYFGPGDYSNIEFDSWTVDFIYGINFESGIFGITFKNSTFKNTTTYSTIGASGANTTSGAYDTSKGHNWSRSNQPMVRYYNCTFDAVDLGYYLAGYIVSGSVVMYESCTFKNGTQGMWSSSGVILSKGTHTFTSVSNQRVWQFTGVHLHVRSLGITVQDNNGQAIENASVMIRQSEGNEEWLFRTDSNGQVKRSDGSDIFLVEKEETSTNNYTNWSDSIASGRYHEVFVTKQGFKPYRTQLTMTSDQTITFNMTPAASHLSLPVDF